jgi:hypothetical protein
MIKKELKKLKDKINFKFVQNDLKNYKKYLIVLINRLNTKDIISVENINHTETFCKLICMDIKITLEKIQLICKYIEYLEKIIIKYGVEIEQNDKIFIDNIKSDKFKNALNEMEKAINTII